MDAETNVLLTDWSAPFGLPPYDRIRAHHFQPALVQAMERHRAELEDIAGDAVAPNFENTVAAFDRAGALLVGIEAVFHSLAASATSPELQAVQRQLAAPMAAHWSAMFQHGALFARLDVVHGALAQTGSTSGQPCPTAEPQGLVPEQQQLTPEPQRRVFGQQQLAPEPQRLESGQQQLTPEQQRLVQRLHRDFVRAGAQLPTAERARYAAVMQRLAELTTQFGQNVLHDESAFALPLPDESAMAGLPDFVRAAARQAASERGIGGAGGVGGVGGASAVPVISLSRSLIVPFLSFSTRRDLREQAWRAWVGRGEQPGSSDNRQLAAQILRLRREQAQLLGYANYAELALTDTMARTPQRVWALLDDVWARALPAFERERAMLVEAMQAAGEGHTLEPWDWRFWAEKIRVSHFALDEAETKPYFALPNMVAAVFDCAQRLFGLRFERRDDVQAYHPDVVAYAVSDSQGRAIGLFLHDNFGRPNKRSGAWMSALRWQHRNAAPGGAPSLPVILNNNNFAKAAPGQPTLLSVDDVRTLFHEFGHGLHGLLSDVNYSRQSGTKVLRDFVELPSQLFEHWGQEREVLRRHARHFQTGQTLPEALIDRIEAARKFGSGYETLRYTASAMVDMAAHQSPLAIDDVVEFESRLTTERGLPAAAGLNHRLPHFQHLFSSSSYAAGYYVYLWAEVLDADAYQAFVEAQGPFDVAVAARLKRCIYSAGDSVEPGATYREFRGRDARVEPMLRDRGLMD